MTTMAAYEDRSPIILEPNLHGEDKAGLNLGLNLGLPGLSLIDAVKSAGTGSSLVVVNGSVLEKGSDGSLADLGIKIGAGSGSSASLVNIGGNVFERTSTGGLVDLGLDIGSGGVISLDVGVGTGTGTGKPPAGGGADPDALAVFRFFNAETGAHFYTADTQERDFVVGHHPGMKLDGHVFTASSNPSDGPEVFRFYNEETRTHFFTASAAERDQVLSTLHEYTYEGVAYTAYANDGGGQHQALYRFFNTDTGTHFYTANEAEVEQVKTTLPQYTYEGVAYYVDAP